MPPKVSVIIPTYNRARLLAEAINSVINQTFQDFEIIVADGSSTDNTKEVALGFGSKVKYFNEEHTGLPASGRNLGLRNASGDLIAFLDSDDAWLPEKLEKQVQYLQTRPQYHIVYSNAWMVDSAGKRKHLFVKPGMFKDGNIFRDLIKLNFVTILTVLMRKEVFQKIGFFREDPSVLEDYEYWLRAAQHFEFGFIDEPLALYKDHVGGFSKKQNYGLLKQNILKSLLEDSKTKDNYKEDIIDSYYDSYLNSAAYFLRNCKIMPTAKEVLKYLGYHLKLFQTRTLKET